MKRVIYIPKESRSDFLKLLSLNRDDLNKLVTIFTDAKNETLIDIYLAIMNGLNVSDEDASSIFSVYKYMLFALEEGGQEFSHIVPEIKYILQTFNVQDYDNLIKNIEDNTASFTQLFSVGNIESTHAKRKYLSSEIYNTVVGVRSVCDIRPLFDEKRSKIEEFINSIYLEFTVRDSIDNIKIIPLSLDKEAFQELESEIEKIKHKHETIKKCVSTIGVPIK